MPKLGTNYVFAKYVNINSKQTEKTLLDIGLYKFKD